MSQAIDPNLGGSPPATVSVDDAPPTGQSTSRRCLRSFAFAPLKLGWRLLRPLRRPLVARFDNHIAYLLGVELQGLAKQMSRLSDQVTQTQGQQLTTIREMNIFVEGMVREVARLQAQVQALSEMCAQALPGQSPAAPWYGSEIKELTTSH